ncbi:MAG: hypothetical protein JST73_06995, partial [Actinobacteria bacterium]|nr:hypothetical protein [Actinomycetota bacterium]
MGTDTRVSARRAVVVAFAVLATVGLVACTSAAKHGATSTTLPPTVAAMWAQTGPWVAVAPPTATYVPGPDTPRSVRIEALIQRGSSAPGTTVSKVPEAEDAAQTLYADPTVAEPWADRAVMVGRVAASDIDGVFGPSKGTTAVTIQGAKGRVGRYGDLWFATWPIKVPSSYCIACDQAAFVIGHGLTRERVLAIARTVRQQPTPHAAATALPVGLRSMGSAPGSQGDVSVGVQPQELVMRSGATPATFQVWSGDPRLYAHLAFWASDGKPVETWRRGWTRLVQRGGVTVIVSDSERSDPPARDVQALRAAAGALVPGDAAVVKAALA